MCDSWAQKHISDDNWSGILQNLICSDKADKVSYLEERKWVVTGCTGWVAHLFARGFSIMKKSAVWETSATNALNIQAPYPAI